MTDDFHSRWNDVVTRVSVSVARDFPDSDSEDIAQHLWVVLLEKQEKFKDPDGAGVVGALFQIAKAHGMKLRSQALHISPQYAYRTTDIKRILETVFDRTKWMGGWVPEDAESIKDSADALDLQSDISWGVTQLPEADRQVLGKRFVARDELEEAERKRLQRAIEKLTDIVNTYPRPGHPRRSMTNARAGYIIGSSYE